MSEPLPVYVLVGGRSERFGTAKATYPVDGQPWAVHVASRLSGDLSRAAVVGKAELPELNDLRFVTDFFDADGPLAGVLAAIADRLEQYGQGRLVLASCDLVRPEVGWLRPLAAALDADDALEVAAYRVDDLWQPFPMIAHTCWLERLEAWVAGDGKRSLQAVLNKSNAAAVAWPGLPPNGPAQANTSEELQRLLA